MMVRAICLFGFTLFLLTNVSAQSVNLSDSLIGIFQGPRSLVLKLDTRNSFVSGRGAQVWGIKAGISFRKRFNAGAHFSWLHTRLLMTIPESTHSGPYRIRMFNAGPFAEYIFYRKGPWEGTIPVQLGFGKNFATADIRRPKHRYREGNIVMYEPVMILEYHVANLFAFGGGIGYRLLLQANKDLGQQFTSPFYLIRMRLITDNLAPRVKELFKGPSSEGYRRVH